MLSGRRAGHAGARRELRQRAGRPRGAQDQDGLPDSAAALDQLPSDKSKRAKWRRAARKVVDVVLGVLELIGNLCGAVDLSRVHRLSLVHRDWVHAMGLHSPFTAAAHPWAGAEI